LLDILGSHFGTIAGEDKEALQKTLPGLVKDIVKRQVDIGFDIVNDGEFSKRGGWNYYIRERLSGLEEPAEPLPPISGPQRDQKEFPQFFAANPRGQIYRENTPTPRGQINRTSTPVLCTGPLRYVGQEAVAFDIANIKAAVKAFPDVQPTIAAVALSSDGTAGTIRNQYYKTPEEFLFACADAMHEEYKAITDAGILLQVDAPGIAASWQGFPEDKSLEDYRKYTQLRVEALNHALRDCPEELTRIHICWGSGHGPHKNDLDLRHIIEVVYTINVGCYNIEAANPRHAHEWEVFETFKLPEGKTLMPGVVGHTSDLIEHPELVAQRLVQYANLVGKENLIAGTDCGIGDRVAYPELSWAKLESLVEGARIASKKLWN
jgi:5-methyltetrahydropteroyltriglutamate--homocysteine methyltransferase